MADWAGLNHDLLIAIAERLHSIETYECFGGVCKSWEEAARVCCKSWEVAARRENLDHTIFEEPWLMFAEKDEEPREFSSVSLDIKMTRKIFLPAANKQRCVSCKDWLVISSPDEIESSLLHPLSGVQIHLPKLNTLSNYIITEYSQFIEKAVISANPATSSDYIVVIICGFDSRLGYWKSGDTTWTSMDFWERAAFEDIIYSNNTNKLYGLDEFGSIVCCDIHGPNPTQLLQVSADIPHDEQWATKSYLVELSGEKFLVVRKYVVLDDDRDTYYTKRFKFFEVNIKDGTWVEVYDLGNKALFLGYNTSFFIECSEFNRCKSNCIYFSEDFFDYYANHSDDEGIGGGKDTGIYCVSDGSIQPLFDKKIGRSTITPPTWIGPSF